LSRAVAGREEVRHGIPRPEFTPRSIATRGLGSYFPRCARVKLFQAVVREARLLGSRRGVGHSCTRDEVATTIVLKTLLRLVVASVLITRLAHSQEPITREGLLRTLVAHQERELPGRRLQWTDAPDSVVSKFATCRPYKATQGLRPERFHRDPLLRDQDDQGGLGVRGSAPVLHGERNVPAQNAAGPAGDHMGPDLEHMGASRWSVDACGSHAWPRLLNKSAKVASSDRQRFRRQPEVEHRGARPESGAAAPPGQAGVEP
jgi:hypothetical protein